LLWKRRRRKKAMVQEGIKAPSFTLPDSTGKKYRLEDFKGKTIILYFYPKDDTPGCTKEACDFRDHHSQFKKKGVEVLGVSADNEASHQKFASKYSLPFTLLADKEAKISKEYGVYKEKSMYGKTYMGIERTTFVIDPEGKIKKIYPKVKVDGHIEEILKSF
jgi:peroxiredoxin Q/BCP